MKPFFVGIISPNGFPRNPSLIQDISNLSQAITVTGFSSSDEEFIANCKLTSTEIACKRSHAFMYKKAKSDFEWALILEDDAQFDLIKMENLWSLIQKINPKFPLVISCYLGRWSVIRNSRIIEGALDCLYPPDGAVCYFINSEAMKIASSGFDFIRPADWPLWSKEVNFVVIPGVAHEIYSSISLVDPEQTRREASRSILSKLNEFLGISYFRHFGINIQAIKAIWYWVYRQRIIWYFPYFIGAKRSSEFL